MVYKKVFFDSKKQLESISKFAIFKV